MFGLMGVFIALTLLIVLAYRGVSVLILAPAMALLATLFAVGTPLMATYTQVFMSATGQFIIQFFPLFLLGALFGKLMDDSGSAETIARRIVAQLGPERAILAVVLACAVLTYGGVSLFVVAFAIYPIGAALFRQANIPKRLLPATIALGAFTFTMTALPGTPAIQNAIPMPFFGTTPFAAPVLGIIAAAVMFLCGLLWLTRQSTLATHAQEGYGDHQDQSSQPSTLCAQDSPSTAPLPSFTIAIAPVIVVIILNYLFASVIFPTMNTDYLAKALYGTTDIHSVRGIWAIIVSLTSASLLVMVLNFSRLRHLQHTLDRGASDAVLPIFNTASLVGFGAVIAALPAFELVKFGIDQLSGGNPLVSLAISVNVLAGVTGSASGGMTIALQSLGAEYLALAEQSNIAPELLHRVTTVATGGLDSLPHNGAVVTLLSICRLTHREAYKDIFMVAVVFPIAALIILILLGSIFGSF